jgi:hypothetical protein
MVVSLRALLIPFSLLVGATLLQWSLHMLQELYQEWHFDLKDIILYLPLWVITWLPFHTTSFLPLVSQCNSRVKLVLMASFRTRAWNRREIFTSLLPSSSITPARSYTTDSGGSRMEALYTLSACHLR